MTLRLPERLFALGAVAALAIAPSGCSFDGSGPGVAADDDGEDGQDGEDDDDGGDSGGIGGQPDGSPPDAEPDVCESWVTATPFTPCDIAPEDRGGDLILAAGNYVIDTMAGTFTGPGGDVVHVSLAVAGGSIHMVTAAKIDIQSGAIVRVQGDKPLLMVSWSDIVVAGNIIASSNEQGNGAGANPSACGNSEGGDGGTAAQGGGGGGGGGFGGEGGVAGAGGSGNGVPGLSGSVQTQANELRGGCRGGNGGVTDAELPEAQGGAGGGALALSALTSISIAATGVLQAGGAGGAGGVNDEGGGGGGGSGGMLWLDGPSVSVTAGGRLVTSGGGGGEGAESSQAGAAGDPASANPTRAIGGTGGDAGDGGAGSGQEGPEGNPGIGNAEGGGGGGGGTGYIQVNGTFAEEAGALIIPEPVEIAPAGN